jgi:hypothetical protein
MNNEDFAQWGMFRSRFIESGNDPLELDLRGFRVRTLETDLCLERLTTAFMQVTPLPMF